MSKTIQFTDAEIAEEGDYDNISLFGQAADDQIVGGAIAYPHHWAGFTITATSGTQVTVNPGRLFKAEIVYSADDAIPVSLGASMPLVTGDTKWVALLVRGKVDTIQENRLIETDADTGEQVLVSVPKVTSRDVEIIVQQGIAGPTPLKPEVAADQCCLAFVLLATGTGIQTIEAGEGWRVKTLFEVEGRVTSLEVSLASALQSIATIKTDIANLAARLKDIPQPAIIEQMKRDIAMTRRKLNLPDTARAYWYDNGLPISQNVDGSLNDQWDQTHANWLARVKEGVRFAYAQEQDAQLALVDESSSAIQISSGRLMLPAWTEVARITVEPDGSGTKNISQLQHTITTAVRREISRQAVDYGPTINVCENNAEWSFVTGLAAGTVFTKNGETFQALGVSATQPVPVPGHTFYGVRQVYYRNWIDVYWDYVTESIGVNGSVYAQSFLNAQPGILTSIDLSFSRVGSDGEVHLFICELNDASAPNFTKVIAKTSITQPNLHLGWNRFSFRPTLMEAGKRYAWYTVTTGNHALDTVSGNKFGQGSLFFCTDGAFSQGDPLVDFAMRINFASFATTRLDIEFAALTLASGMTEFGLLYGGWKPGGTDIIWSIKPSGATAWTTIEGSATDTMNGLPAFVQLKATFVGTTDLMPAMVMDATARAHTARPRGDMRAVSNVINFGVSTTNIVVETRWDNYDPAHHTAVNKIFLGSTETTATTTTTIIDDAKPSRRTVRSTFTVSSSTSCRVEPSATTDNVVTVPFIQDVAVYVT